MRDVRINWLLLESFKGIDRFRLDLGGHSANIYGDNATGKTTIYDALTWLLFGKDSHGATRFEVKPLCMDGNAVRGAMPTVEAELSVDGNPILLKKILREKWERHRGGEERYGGNTTDYFVNEVPVKEKDFRQAVNEIVNEDTFRMLTNTYRFLRDMPWKERRSVLFDAAGVCSEEQLLSEPGFDGLRDELNGKTVDDFKTMIQKQRKDTNGILNLLPARIDECERQLVELPDSFDDTERKKLDKEISTLRQAMAAMDVSEGSVQLDNEIAAKELELRELDMQNKAHRQSQNVPVVDERPALQREINAKKHELDTASRHKANAELNAMRLDEQISDARAEWIRRNKENFQDGVCHACGQPLPAEKNNQLREAFEQDKQETLRKLVNQSNRDKEVRKQNTEEAAQLGEQISTLKSELTELQERYNVTPAPEQPIIEDLPDYRKKRAALQADIDSLLRRRDLMRSDVQAAKQDKQTEIDSLVQQRRAEDAREAACRQRKEIEKRIAELEDERRTKAAFIDHIDDMLDMCEDFVRMKVERISDAVNGMFHTVRFRLYTENINGGLTDCCDALVDGVPYESLNSAMQINAGLDAIAALSAWYGVQVPLFVDNAESVTQLRGMSGQVIRLIVAEDDKELRYEI